MKETIFKNWNWIRAIRLILGILIIASGIAEKDYLFIFIGAVFTILPILNISTCGTSCSSGACGVDLTKKQ